MLSWFQMDEKTRKLIRLQIDAENMASLKRMLVWRSLPFFSETTTVQAFGR